MQGHGYKTYTDGLSGYLSMFTLLHLVYLLAIMTLEALGFPVCFGGALTSDHLEQSTHVSSVLVDH